MLIKCRLATHFYFCASADAQGNAHFYLYVFVYLCVCVCVYAIQLEAEPLRRLVNGARGAPQNVADNEFFFFTALLYFTFFLCLPLSLINVGWGGAFLSKQNLFFQLHPLDNSVIIARVDLHLRVND